MVHDIQQMAIERDVPNIARVSTTFYKPVPVGTNLRVVTSPLRDGPKASHIQAQLYNEETGKETMRMFAVCLRKETISNVPPVPLAAQPDRPPFSSEPPFQFPSYVFSTEQSYGSAMEIRHVEGAWSEGPTTFWFRPRIDLVEGEKMSGLERLVTVGNSAGGISFYVEMLTHSFVNADLNVNIIRPPNGDWICMKARTILNPELGSGVATSELFDERGIVAIGSQTLLLQNRR